jgi:LmbE family N-acetylglucosaminyl deacetylase
MGSLVEAAEDGVMLGLTDTSRLKNILCLGAHSDDIEIGCGGTVLRLLEKNPALNVTWVVFCGADARRAEEAKASAQKFGAHNFTIHKFRDAYLPYEGAAVKDAFEELKKTLSPDAIFTHFRDDRHQDHRIISDLTWNTWRSHLIFEYEIPKYDGDLGQPNVFSALSEDVCRRKIDLLMSGFASQANHRWFTADTFWAMLRIRGVECDSATRFAEAFHCRKMLL